MLLSTKVDESVPTYQIGLTESRLGVQFIPNNEGTDIEVMMIERRSL